MWNCTLLAELGETLTIPNWTSRVYRCNKTRERGGYLESTNAVLDEEVSRLQDCCEWHWTASLHGVQISPALLCHLGGVPLEPKWVGMRPHLQSQHLAASGLPSAEEAERLGGVAVRAGEAEERARGTQKPTCFGCHFQEVAIQVDVELRCLAGQRDARAVPAHGQVLLEADSAGAQHQVHRLGPREGAGPACVILHQHLKGRGRGGAVFCQNVLTRPLKVKCPSVKSVVVGISEYRANAGLCGWVRDKSRS